MQIHTIIAPVFSNVDSYGTLIPFANFFFFCSGMYGDSDSYEHTSSHFAGFFLTSIVMVFAVYAVYHNRQKVL